MENHVVNSMQSPLYPSKQILCTFKLPLLTTHVFIFFTKSYCIFNYVYIVIVSRTTQQSDKQFMRLKIWRIIWQIPSNPHFAKPNLLSPDVNHTLWQRMGVFQHCQIVRIMSIMAMHPGLQHILTFGLWVLEHGESCCTFNPIPIRLIQVNPRHR